MSVDPLAPDYPWYTPYQFAGNTPIQAIDLDGLEPYKIVSRSFAPRGSFEKTHFDGIADDRITFEIADHQEISARIHFTYSIELESTEVFGKEIESQPTYLKDGILAWNIKWPTPDEGHAESIDMNKEDSQFHVYSTYSAKNGLQVGPGIDIQSTVFFDSSEEGMLKIRAWTTGNVFPAQESMIFDQNETGLFLGTSIAEGSPLYDVWGSGRFNNLYANLLKISVDEDGNFNGVFGTDENGNEVMLSPDLYNEQFITQDVWDGQNGRSDYEEE